MASSYYKLSGDTTNPNTDWTTEVVLERDPESGEVTKSISATEPVQLSAEDKKKVEDLGYKVEQSSKDEAEEAESSVATGGDVAGSGPIFGTSSRPNQASNDRNDKTDQS